MNTVEQIKLWAREIKSVSQTGLEYGNDVFDKERYLKLNDISIDMLSFISGKEIKEVEQLLPIEAGYHTPKIAVRGLVFREGKLLMVKEATDGLWCLPGGWCDIDYSPSENIEKEIVEETGLTTKAVRLLAFFDQTKENPSITMQHIYTVYYLCQLISGELQGSIETHEVDFFDFHDLPPLSTERITNKQLEIAIKVASDESKSAYFD